MWQVVVEWTVRALALYVALGTAFAVPFVLRGVARVDATAAQGTWGFRLAILPGAVAFWPLLLVRWIRGGGHPPAERNAHRDAVGGAR